MRGDSQVAAAYPLILVEIVSRKGAKAQGLKRMKDER
jgi:hypothetical protein